MNPSFIFGKTENYSSVSYRPLSSLEVNRMNSRRNRISQFQANIRSHEETERRRSESLTTLLTSMHSSLHSDIREINSNLKKLEEKVDQINERMPSENFQNQFDEFKNSLIENIRELIKSDVETEAKKKVKAIKTVMGNSLLADSDQEECL